MKKSSLASFVLAVLMSSLLFGCAGTPRGPAKNASGTSVLSTDVVVSPSAFRGDPVGYLTAILGAPHLEDPKGRFYWKADRSRTKEMRRAVSAWCADNGGKLPPKQPSLNEPCTDAQGQLLTRFNVHTNVENMSISAETPAMARQFDSEDRAQVEDHKRYVTSNGATGTIKLMDGRSFEVLRFGHAGAPIDYYLIESKGQPYRLLREVRSLRRTAKAGEGKPARFDIRFVDGKIGEGTHKLFNAYREMWRDGSLGSTTVTFAGITSEHLLLVVRSNKTSTPLQVRIAIADIKELKIDKIDERPVAPIAVRGRDDKVASALLKRWKATAGKTNKPFHSRVMHDGPTWCSEVRYATIESSLVCEQLWAEHTIAIQTGILSPQTTPALLSGESIYTLRDRTLM